MLGDKKKNSKLQSCVGRLFIDCFLLLVIAGLWHLGGWAKSKNELFIGFVVKAGAICLMAIIIWSALSWLTEKSNNLQPVKLVRCLAVLGEDTFRAVGAIIDIGMLLAVGIVSLLMVYVIFRLPFVFVSSYIFFISDPLIVYLTLSLIVIVFLEFGVKVFNLIERLFGFLIEDKPSRAAFIDIFRLLFSGKFFRILVYFLFFLYLVFYAIVDLSQENDISIAWVLYLYNIKESVLYAFYTILAYDAFRVNLVNYEPKNPV